MLQWNTYVVLIVHYPINKPCKEGIHSFIYSSIYYLVFTIQKENLHTGCVICIWKLELH